MHHVFFSPYCCWNMWFSKPVDSKVFPSRHLLWFCLLLFFIIIILKIQLNCLLRLLLLVVLQFPPPWLCATGGAKKSFCGLIWVPALFCFFNRGWKSRVSHPSRPLPGAQTTGEESTGPRAAYEASGQVCIHSSFGHSSCSPLHSPLWLS